MSSDSGIPPESLSPDIALALEGIRQKVFRTHKHLEDLQRVHWDFMHGRIPPYVILDRVEAIEQADDGKLRAVYVAQARVSSPPPMELSIIFGDVIHNCHSALDQIVAQLVRLNGRRVQNATGFPICKDFESFRAEGYRMLLGVSEDAIIGIEAIQPYHPVPHDYRDAHRLTLLKKFSRQDKHHVFIPAFTSVGGIQIGTGHQGIESVGRRILATGAVEDGTEMIRADIVLSGNPVEANLNYSINLGVGLRERGRPVWMIGMANAMVDMTGKFAQITAREFFGVEWDDFPPPPEHPSPPLIPD